jgi:type III pantothenate kinase
MMLLIDMGNSSIKWATLEQDRLSPQQRLPYKLYPQAWLKLDVPSQGVWVSNVAGPQKAEILTHWVKNHWGLKPTFVKTSSYECGVKNGYDNPKQLGVDRWLALIGAHYLETGPLCVVDCGTAVTLDVLFANGHHQGGLIMPGVTTMHKALLSDTYVLAHLNKTLHRREEKPFLAHDTQTGISLGTLYGVIGLLEYVINSLEKQGISLKLILTGGTAPALESLLHQIKSYRHIPDLVLQGLKAVVACESSPSTVNGFNFMTDKMPTIVIVDDSATVMRLYQHGMKSLHVNLKCITSSVEALEYLQVHQAELLLLDILMPGMDGLTLLRNLRDIPHLKEVPVIFIPSTDFSQDRYVAKRLGAVDFIVKPLRFKEIHDIVCKYLEVKPKESAQS